MQIQVGHRMNFFYFAGNQLKKRRRIDFESESCEIGQGEKMVEIKLS